LAHSRTWTHIAHKGSGLDDSRGWQDRTRAIEDRLSDALHERLTQRFVDRRTSVLTRGLTEDPALLDVQIGEDNALTVGGEIIGHVTGLRFRPVGHDSTDQRRIIRQAAIRLLGPAPQQRAATILHLPDTTSDERPEGKERVRTSRSGWSH